MTNPYSSPTDSPGRGLPTVRPISWLATIPQLLALSGAVAIGWWATRPPGGLFLGCTVYLIYSFGSRRFIPRAHRRGIRLNSAHRFADAIRAFQESYDFFTRHRWLDRYRSITMMCPAAVSYREMALINIAFAYSQLGDGRKMKEYYQRALEEFPGSVMADCALKFIESVERLQSA